MWVAQGGPPGEPVLIYHYAPSRGAPVAADVLGEYEGYVQTDGYEAYDKTCAREGVVHVGCWAHAQRGFSDAKKAAGRTTKKAGVADQALAFIAKLYAVESERKRYASAEEFTAARRTKVESVLERLHAWLQRQSDRVLPQALPSVRRSPTRSSNGQNSSAISRPQS